MNSHLQYDLLLRDIALGGQFRPDRTNTGTYSKFGTQMRFDMADGFPLITTKRVHMKSVVGELLWMLSGSTSAKELREKYGVTIWDEWGDDNGDLGPVYGAQWRDWGGATPYNDMDMTGRGIDQITQVMKSIIEDPWSRRHIVSAWNVSDLKDMALAPCHAFFQFSVQGDPEHRGLPSRLSLSLTQRSADMFLGVPFNIASYALLLEMVAQQTGLQPGDLIWNGGDTHIYSNHIDQVSEQLTRTPRQFPRLELRRADSIFDYKPEDVIIHGYDPDPSIKAPVAV